MSRHVENRKAGMVTVGEELLKLAKYIDARESGNDWPVYNGWDDPQATRLRQIGVF